VVVPTSHNVALHYGASRSDRVGQSLTLLGVIFLIGVTVLVPLRKRWKRTRKPDTSPAP
jgi:hypothetical protein